MSGKKEPNTIIGGIGGTINTKALLATKLGISESIIGNFEVIGSDVHCRMKSNYSVGIPGIGTFENSTEITSYIDLDGKFINLNVTNCFRNSTIQNVFFPNLNQLNGFDFYNCVQLTQLYMPNLTSTLSNRQFYNTRIPIMELPNLVSVSSSNTTFRQMTATLEINMPKLKVLGSPAVHNDCFLLLKTGCIIRVHEDLATANAGAPHAALVWVKANRSAIVEFYDDNGDYVSTL